MSKAFGAAGLRLGYLAAHRRSWTPCSSYGCPTTCRPSRRRPPAALEHTDTLLKYVEQLKAERDRLVSKLRHWVRDRRSDANFVQFGRFDNYARGLAEDPRPGRPRTRTTAFRGGCGCPPAPPKRTTRSSTRSVT
ncbi:aminotransferase class I/II-fold pyridoxal phosphate-dependent enzyme [Streptomyces griseorubiginosus]